MLPTEALQGLTVPTLANAIETFGVVAPNAGYNRQPVRCHFPEFGMLIAHAVTLTTSTDTPPEQAPERIDDPVYWRWLADRYREHSPLVAVLQDTDEPAGGAMWGEWNANVHRRLGCVGTITHGAVRDPRRARTPSLSRTSEIFRLCQSPEFTIDELARTQARVLERWPHGERTLPS